MKPCWKPPALPAQYNMWGQPLRQSPSERTSVKRWEEGDRLHMAGLGEGGLRPSREGVLEKACWGGAEGELESVCSAASGTETRINVWAWGSAPGSRRARLGSQAISGPACD